MAKKRNKQYRPRECTSQKSLKDVIYKLNKNTLTMGDMYNIMIAIQHLFWIQIINREYEYKFIQMTYLNSVKRSIIKLLEIIKKQTTYKDGTYFADSEHLIELHPKTKHKILWFYVKIYEPTLNLWSLLNPTKMAKLKQEARQQLDFFMILHCPAMRDILE